MPTSTVTSKGQTTIPKVIRQHLRLRPGHRIDFVVGEDGQVVLRPAAYDAADLQGLLEDDNGPTLSTEEMRMVVRKRAAQR